MGWENKKYNKLRYKTYTQEQRLAFDITTEVLKWFGDKISLDKDKKYSHPLYVYVRFLNDRLYIERRTITCVRNGNVLDEILQDKIPKRSLLLQSLIRRIEFFIQPFPPIYEEIINPDFRLSNLNEDKRFEVGEDGIEAYSIQIYLGVEHHEQEELYDPEYAYDFDEKENNKTELCEECGSPLWDCDCCEPD